jgi:uncharacterized protein (DUF362 family)
MPKSRVALVCGDDRSENVAQALQLLADEIDLSGKQRVLIKPNFVTPDRPLACTHADAVRAVLDFVRARYDGRLTIAEGPSARPAAESFRILGYESLARKYDARLVDLNLDDPVPVNAYNWRLRPLRLHMARSVLESDFRISVGPPKTHDAVIVTLGLKNMVMGTLISRFTHGYQSQNSSGPNIGTLSKLLWRVTPSWLRRLPPVEWLQFRVMSTLQPSDKMKMHQSYPVINLNLALLAPRVAPHLSVIDAFEAMEGDGPSKGSSVPLRLALASADALAADVVATNLMGFDVDDIGYLHYCRELGLGAGDLSQISLIGNASLADCARPFRPHSAHGRQLRWQLPHAEEYLT